MLREANMEPVEPALLAMLAAATRVRPEEPPVEVEARGSDEDDSLADDEDGPPPAPSAPPGVEEPRPSRSAGAALLCWGVVVGVGMPAVAVADELEDVLDRLMLPLEERETGRMNDRRERGCVSAAVEGEVSSIEDCRCWWCCLLLLDCDGRRG